MKNVTVFLFDDFTSIDALGPTEVLSKLNKIYKIEYFSRNGGPISSSTGAVIHTEKIKEPSGSDVLIVPGGFGTRNLVNDTDFISLLEKLVSKAEYVLSICSGSALLAKSGCLNDKRATGNKLSWDWVISQNSNVKWVKKARWVVDGKFYSSSGVTAGIDMTLGFVSDIHGYETARKISNAMEYLWNENKDNDPFCF